jgi:hypothetical protein
MRILRAMLLRRRMTADPFDFMTLLSVAGAVMLRVVRDQSGLM